MGWLSKHAAFKSHIDASVELGAFAERFAAEPIEIDDWDLRNLRDRFDELSDRNAEELGRKVGAALLLDGFTYKGGRQQRVKVSPASAYLSRTLDSDYPNWPVAAGTLPGIQWIASRYDDHLKTAATRTRRRLENGTIPRGPRKFLMLLGAEVAPRLERTGSVRWGGETRVKELRAASAEQVPYDDVSPDLTRVLRDLQRSSKSAARVRSPALLRALSRNWERVYKNRQTVPSQHVARVYIYERGPVTAAWLNELRESDWVAVGRGERVPPAAAVIKNAATQTLYGTFAAGLEPDEVSDGIALALRLITDVRIGDLLSYIEKVRDGVASEDESQLLQLYRNIATRCPTSAAWNNRVGEVTVQELRRRFSSGAGLIYLGVGQWRRPQEVLRGKDIFHDRQRFVPGGPALGNLWLALGVREPSLDDCIGFCRSLSGEAWGVETDAALMDVYRYMERLTAAADRRQRDRLRGLPVICSGHWARERPIYLIEDDELRGALAGALPSVRFWAPPCETRDFPNLIAKMGITASLPELDVAGDRAEAMSRGETLRMRFGQAVDHLSDELARNDPATREKLAIGWDSLKALPLFVHEDAVSVRARDEQLSAAAVRVHLQALMRPASRELHVSETALGDREHGGRAIATLFPRELRRKIGGEWALAWQKSLERRPDAIRLAADEALLEALNQQADKINGVRETKIKVTTPASRTSTVEPRTLKDAVGSVSGAKVSPGSDSQPAKSGGGTTLSVKPPEPGKSQSSGSEAAPLAYTNADLEQRGWEILASVLNTSQAEPLVDFRRRHGVGADGVINWKTFVEMKATGRAPQASIEMSNAEYERAKERGVDFILALVSGLETGQKDEVRLIFDPANRLLARPVNGIRLVGLLEAPSVIVGFEDPDPLKE